MRYICKACGRKREEFNLKPVGKSKNKLNIWLCRYGDKYWSNCNSSENIRIENLFKKNLDVQEHRSEVKSEYQFKNQIDLEGMIYDIKKEAQEKTDAEYIKTFAKRYGIDIK